MLNWENNCALLSPLPFYVVSFLKDNFKYFLAYIMNNTGIRAERTWP